MSKPYEICWNCRHASHHAYYGVDRCGFVHCQHPNRAVRCEPEDPDARCAWDTFREFYNTCNAFELKPELEPKENPE